MAKKKKKPQKKSPPNSGESSTTRSAQQSDLNPENFPQLGSYQSQPIEPPVSIRSIASDMKSTPTVAALPQTSRAGPSSSVTSLESSVRPKAVPTADPSGGSSESPPKTSETTGTQPKQTETVPNMTGSSELKCDLIECQNCKRKHFRFMNCATSRLLRLINYLPIIGSVKNVIDLIIISCKGESDEILEAAIITVIGLLVDYFTFGTMKGAFQGMFKCGNAFKICSEQLTKKITCETSGQAIEKMADEMLKQAINGILKICEEEACQECSKLIVSNAEKVAVNATKNAAKKLLYDLPKVVGTKVSISYMLICLANGTEDMIEFARRLLSRFTLYNAQL